MSVQYPSNENRQGTAVQLPIEECKMIKSMYPNVDSIDFSLSEWHKEIIDNRLAAIEKDSNKIRPISELVDELKK